MAVRIKNMKALNVEIQKSYDSLVDALLEAGLYTLFCRYYKFNSDETMPWLAEDYNKLGWWCFHDGRLSLRLKKLDDEDTNFPDIAEQFFAAIIKKFDFLMEIVENEEVVSWFRRKDD